MGFEGGLSTEGPLYHVACMALPLWDLWGSWTIDQWVYCYCGMAVSIINYCSIDIIAQYYPWLMIRSSYSFQLDPPFAHTNPSYYFGLSNICVTLLSAHLIFMTQLRKMFSYDSPRLSLAIQIHLCISFSLVLTWLVIVYPLLKYTWSIKPTLSMQYLSMLRQKKKTSRQ